MTLRHNLCASVTAIVLASALVSAPALGQKAPASPVLRVNPSSTATTAPLEMQDGSGHWVPLGALNPTTGAFAPQGLPAVQAKANANATEINLIGAVCDALSTATPTDDTAVINDALATGHYGDTFRLPRGKQCYTRNVVIPPGVHLKGGSGVIDNPGGSNYVVLVGQLPGLLLERTGTVTFAAGSGISDMAIIRADNGVRMALPAANASAFTGDCLSPTAGTGTPGTSSQTSANDALIENVMCVGQARALAPQTAGISRLSARHFWGDVNPGAGRAAVSLIGSNDTSRLDDLHFWPFATSNSTDQAILGRSGTGLYLNGQNDDTEIDGAFFYDFDIGADFEGTGEVPVGRLWVDSAKSAPGTYGVIFGPSTTGVHISQLWSFGSAVSLYSNAGGGNHNAIGMGFLSNPSSTAVLVDSGDLDIGRTTTRSVPDGQSAIIIHSGASTVSGNLYDQSVASSGTVSAPAGATTDHYAALSLTTPNRANGTPQYTANIIAPPPIASAVTMLLPPTGDRFAMTGHSFVQTLAGTWGGREITIAFPGDGTGTPTLVTSGNLALAGGGQYTPPVGSYLRLVYDSTAGKFVEIARGPDTAATAAWQSYTPTVTPFAGAITTLGTVSGRFHQVGHTVTFRVTVPITTNGTAAGGLAIGLPVASSATGNAAVAGRETTATGVGLQGSISPNTGSVGVTRYDNAYPGADGATIVISGTYESP